MDYLIGVIQGRIGGAKRIHCIMETQRLHWEEKGKFKTGLWGIALCGWAGMVSVTKEKMTCGECICNVRTANVIEQKPMKQENVDL